MTPKEQAKRPATDASLISADQYVRIGHDDRTGKTYVDGRVVSVSPPGALAEALALNAALIGGPGPTLAQDKNPILGIEWGELTPPTIVGE